MEQFKKVSLSSLSLPQQLGFVTLGLSDRVLQALRWALLMNRSLFIIHYPFAF